MRILSFIFVLCLLALTSHGQEQKEKKLKPKRTDNFVRMKGIRFGVDATRPFQDLWVKGNRYGYEFSADMELWPNLFPVIESGYDIMKNYRSNPNGVKLCVFKTHLHYEKSIKIQKAPHRSRK